MPDVTIHIGGLKKIPLDRYEQREIMANATVSFHKGEKLQLTKKKMESMVKVESKVIEMVDNYLDEEEARVREEYRARKEAEAEAKKKAEKESSGRDLLGLGDD